MKRGDVLELRAISVQIDHKVTSRGWKTVPQLFHLLDAIGSRILTEEKENQIWKMYSNSCRLNLKSIQAVNYGELAKGTLRH